MNIKHLELLKSEGLFFIKINSLLGRVSLFADHPNYKFKQAIDLKNHLHETLGELSLVPLRKKNMYILEDKDHNGEKSQNFIFASDEISSLLKSQSLNQWIKEHAIDFFTRSISVSFFLIYALYFFTFMRYYNTTSTLHALRYITGVLTLVFAVTFYYLRSSRTKSSFLKLCFKFELVMFIISGTISNIHHLSILLNDSDYTL
jgi:hypothetical protein